MAAYQLARENALEKSSSVTKDNKCELFLLSQTMYPPVDLDAF